MILLVAMTWFGINTKSAIYTKPIVAMSESQSEVNINSFLHKAAGTNKDLNILIEAIEKDTSNLNSITALKNAGQQSKIDIFTAYALYLEGIIKKDINLVQQSANLFFETGTHDPDTLVDKTTYQVYAIRACDFILKTNPKNIESIVRKATAIVYFGGDIMSGVGLLKQAELLDSNYTDAQHHLMLLDLQSGQYKKAEKRLKKLVHLQPENQQYSDLLLKLETQQIK